MKRADVWQQLRAPYEFTQKTKIDALNKAHWQCEECGKKKSETKEGYLEIDHRIPIWFVLSYFPTLAPAVVKSIANARVLCKDCHERIHLTEKKKDYIERAKTLLASA